MHKKIQSFINDLKSNKRLSSFDEASTKQAVVLRMLSFLGWDIFNVEEVYPDYAANSSNVSYALRIGGLNKIFVEVKKISEELDDHQEKFVALVSEEDTDFAAMLSEYHELDRKVFRFEQHNQPISDHSLEDMKYRRVNLKNRLYHRLKTYPTNY